MPGKRMSGEERREQIIRTAVDLFARKGLSDVTTRKIAEAAAINEATIYKYFESKEDLYNAVVEFYGRVLGDRYQAVLLDLNADIRSVLTTVARNVLEFGKENPNMIRLMLFSALQNHPFAENFFHASIKPVFSKLETIIRNAQQQGEAEDTLESFYAVLSFMGVLIYFNLARNVVLKRAFSTLDEDKFVKHVVDIFLDGISSKQNGEES